MKVRDNSFSYANLITLLKFYLSWLLLYFQSFNLEITGGTAMTNKQTLLGTIGSILATHTPLKRSYDSHFKAFVCAALK